ncbi:MAG: hypothetical protein IJ371_06260 [Clostridia bacterium]|nr:hypothetical protein [Clostridia bacterium]
MKNIYLVIYDYSTDKYFKKHFETEYEKDKFKNKLMFSKKLVVVKDSAENYYLD